MNHLCTVEMVGCSTDAVLVTSAQHLHPYRGLAAFLQHPTPHSALGIQSACGNGCSNEHVNCKNSLFKRLNFHSKTLGIKFFVSTLLHLQQFCLHRLMQITDAVICQASLATKVNGQIVRISAHEQYSRTTLSPCISNQQKNAWTRITQISDDKCGSVNSRLELFKKKLIP